MEDWFGWVLLFLTFGLAIVDAKIYRSATVTICFWLAVLAHNLDSLFNAYLGSAYGASQDAVSFHFYAINQNWAYNPFGTSEFYIYYLSVVYGIFGPSMFFGQQLSVLASTVKILIFIQALCLTGGRRYLAPLILLLGVLPGPVMFCSVTLREAYQSLFMLGTVVAALKLRQTRNLLWLPVVYGCLVGLASSQPGLLIYSLLALPLVSIWAFGTGSWRVRVALRILGVAAAFYVVAFALSMANNLDSLALQALASGEAAEFTEQYGETATESRTTYPVKLDLSSPVSLLVTGPIQVGQYLFSPLPWQIGSVLDIYAFFEGFLRFLLILAALARAARTRGEERSWTLFLLVMAGTMECLWAAGTYNWGTAIRHHVVAYPVLLLAGGPTLMQWLEAGLKRSVRFLFARSGAPRGFEARPEEGAPIDTRF